MKPIYHAEQIISAYETAMGLPEAMRMANDDGTFKVAATQQHIDKVCEKALAAAELPTDWNGLVDRMRDCLLVKELAVGETVLFAATEPYGGPGDFDLRPGVIQAIDAANRYYPQGDENHILVVSADGGLEILDNLRNGKCDACISQQPITMGADAVQMAYDYVVNGVEPESNV